MLLTSDSGSIFFSMLGYYGWSWEARLLRGNLKPSMASLMDMRVPWQQPNEYQVNIWFRGWLCRSFCSFVLFLPWRKPEGWNTSASFKLAFLFTKNVLIMNIAGFLLGFWSVHWRGFFVSPASSVSVLVKLFFFTCIPFHYLVFIKITFFFSVEIIYAHEPESCIQYFQTVCPRNLILI